MIHRIKEVIQYYKLSTRAFSKIINFNYTTLNNYLTGRRTTIDSELIVKILMSLHDISAEWLLRGQGNMILPSGKQAEKEDDKISKLIDTIALLQDTINKNKKTISKLEAKNKQIKTELETLKKQQTI
ncbi:XRE family transcriptional regulator [uncultured Phocaeicola sp.]|uniref:XRE family transcriptional regulator n=1 Tax=uncultured Phocaeicola sp. TaxID=990718 RepID=UPI0025F25EBF|nr:XRE family transcriptional regulator [uncultured Phocaeicola sp.]